MAMPPAAPPLIPWEDGRGTMEDVGSAVADGVLVVIVPLLVEVKTEIEVLMKGDETGN